jgi:hypothetical protein
MHPHLETCLKTVLEATKDGGDECNTRRDPAKWSVAEIVEHLSRAYSGTAKGFERCVEKGTPLASRTTFKQRMSQFVLINLGIFPEGRQAPKHIIPTGEINLAAVLEATRKNLEWLDAAASKTRDALGTGKMLDHPIIGALTIDQWLAFHVVHTQHHAKQIRQRR